MMKAAMSFEINNECRVMDNSELVYVLTNNKDLTYHVRKGEAMEDFFPLSEVLDQLTPGRKMVALAAIELYRRSKCIDTGRLTSSGGITEVSVDIRVVMKQAMMCDATGLFVCHNHPAGNNRPSEADNRLTDRIKKAGEIMNVRLMDHLIIAQDSYYSYMDEGLLF